LEKHFDDLQALKKRVATSVVPTGLGFLYYAYPALKRWAKICCAYGAGPGHRRIVDVAETIFVVLDIPPGVDSLRASS